MQSFAAMKDTVNIFRIIFPQHKIVWSWGSSYVPTIEEFKKIYVCKCGVDNYYWTAMLFEISGISYMFQQDSYTAETAWLTSSKSL